jgi:hypothetical protein
MCATLTAGREPRNPDLAHDLRDSAMTGADVMAIAKLSRDLYANPLPQISPSPGMRRLSLIPKLLV